MKLVGLGGGIGAGKSSVSARLAAKGAVVVDADLIARWVVQPTGPAYAGLVACFGTGVLQEDGTLNRAALAKIVFNDADALADLNKITHPAINAEIARQIEVHRGTDAVVVLDAALLFIVPVVMIAKMIVDVDPEIAIARLVAQRGFGEDDARSRIRNQMSREERLSQADLVIDNSGTPEALDTEVERVWTWIATLSDSEDTASDPAPAAAG